MDRRTLVKAAHQKMQHHGYSGFTGDGTQFSRTQTSARTLAMAGGYYKDNRNFCNSYFNRESRAPIAYIPIIAFITKSYALETARKRLSVSSSIEYFYPTVDVEVFEAYIDAPPPTAIRVLTEKGVWTCSYKSSSPGSGHGKFGVYPRGGGGSTIYEEAFEYEFEYT